MDRKQLIEKLDELSKLVDPESEPDWTITEHLHLSARFRKDKKPDRDIYFRVEYRDYRVADAMGNGFETSKWEELFVILLLYYCGHTTAKNRYLVKGELNKMDRSLVSYVAKNYQKDGEYD